MNQDLINKLPPDAKKEFLKYAIKFDEKKKQKILRPNPHDKKTIKKNRQLL